MNYPLEILIQVQRDDCKIVDAVMKMSGVSSISRLKIEPDETLHSFEKDNFTDRDMLILKKLSINVARMGQKKIWVYGKSCSACKAMALSEAVILSSTSVDNNRINYRVLVENRGAMRRLMKKLEEADLKPLILEGPEEKKIEISDREFSVLKMCYELGYFENERKASLTEIAKIIGISTSSLSETLRRAMKKLVKDYLKESKS
ncbi:MAG: helix-turn-helix domain-containing protein [Candidatus Thermoplasmatota archaeon]|jgi:predicted DNA binding protein|nr:helix-turn-helix domain-containing protein [Candidatus Thermoplasmatota archaeon]MCL5987580.1 helix-turn-helix domain-containing protein [Candidatus Thermoplasmatota archaeon]